MSRRAMDLSSLAAFLTAGTVGLAMALASFWVARRSGLTSVQQTLIDTLKENAEALNQRVDLLEEQLATERQKVQTLEAQVKDLNKTVIDLSKQNARLREQVAAAETR